MADPGAGTHRLHVTGTDCSNVSLVVAVRDGSVMDVGDDLNVLRDDEARSPCAARFGHR